MCEKCALGSKGSPRPHARHISRFHRLFKKIRLSRVCVSKLSENPKNWDCEKSYSAAALPCRRSWCRRKHAAPPVAFPNKFHFTCPLLIQSPTRRRWNKGRSHTSEAATQAAASLRLAGCGASCSCVVVECFTAAGCVTQSTK